MILGAMVVYALVAIGAVLLAVRHAKRRGRSAARWGWGAALIMFLIPFWDWLPTVAMHRYYCGAEAGFWVYQTPAQWKAENPGVLETAVRKPSARTGNVEFDERLGRKSTHLLNNRFNWVVTQQNYSFLLPIVRSEEVVLDVKENKVLARYVDFAAGGSVRRTAGPPGSWKFWLQNPHCGGGRKNQGALRNIRTQVQ